MEEQYRVLHVMPRFGGGISSLVGNLIQNKTEDFRFDVLAYAYKNGESFVAKTEAAGGHCYTMPRPRSGGFRVFRRRVDEVMRAGHYDVLHCHFSGWMALPFLNAAKRNGIQTVVLHAHASVFDRKTDRIPLMRGIVYNRIYRKTTAFFTCSDLAAECVFGGKNLAKRPAVLIPNGMDAQSYSVPLSAEERENYKKEFGLSRDEKVLLYVGRFTKQKNQTFLLAVAKALQSRSFRFRLLLAGVGETQQEIQRQTGAEGLSDCIAFLNRREDAGRLMQFADVMLLPSLYEGLPTVAVECQASGCPALISDTVTRQCDMQLGLVSFLPIDDPAVWADAVMNCKTEHLPPEQCLEKIRAQHFTAEESGRLYCAELRKLLQNPRIE